MPIDYAALEEICESPSNCCLTFVSSKSIRLCVLQGKEAKFKHLSILIYQIITGGIRKFNPKATEMKLLLRCYA